MAPRFDDLRARDCSVWRAVTLRERPAGRAIILPALDGATSRATTLRQRMSRPWSDADLTTPTAATTSLSQSYSPAS
jgi:hypothetical protein